MTKFNLCLDLQVKVLVSISISVSRVWSLVKKGVALTGRRPPTGNISGSPRAAAW